VAPFNQPPERKLIAGLPQFWIAYSDLPEGSADQSVFYLSGIVF